MSPQIINMIVFSILLPATIGLVYARCQHYIQKMPKNRILLLETIARMAAQQVEKENSNLSSNAKKQFAMTSAAKLLKAVGSPTFLTEAMDIAVESAVLLLPGSKDNALKVVEPQEQIEL